MTPICINHGCERNVATCAISSTGKRTYRTVCWKCHEASYGKRQLDDGITPHKKIYCENADGRVGYNCTATIVYTGQLELDHIDGNHLNNDPGNVQTLCKNCHSYKSKMEGDFKKNKIVNQR